MRRSKQPVWFKSLTPAPLWGQFLFIIPLMFTREVNSHLWRNKWDFPFNLIHFCFEGAIALVTPLWHKPRFKCLGSNDQNNSSFFKPTTNLRRSHLETDSILLLSTSLTSPFGSIFHFIEAGNSSEHSFLGFFCFVVLHFRDNFCEVIFTEGVDQIPWVHSQSFQLNVFRKIGMGQEKDCAPKEIFVGVEEANLPV